MTDLAAPASVAPALASRSSVPQASREEVPDPWSLPLENLDLSDSRLWQSGRLHDYLRRLREEDPVHWCPVGPSGPFWSVTRFEDILAVETDHVTFSSDQHVTMGDNPPGLLIKMFITTDPPAHADQRKAVTPGVAPTRLSDLEALIRRRTAAVLDTLPVGETFDWVDRVSIELTTQFLATLFDFPFEDRRLLPFWSDTFMGAETFGGVVSEAERERHMADCIACFSCLWRERAAAPVKFDFLSLMAHSPATRHYIDDPMALLGGVMLLIVGGNDTTRNSMSGGVLFMHQFPEELAKLKGDPALAHNLPSEIIRYQTPLSHQRRTATRDVGLGGKMIRKGERVVMWYASGNRDEAAIPDADRFLIDRKNPRHHLSFGFGVHRCMGNRAAELQVRILWEEILKRFDRIEVVGAPERTRSNLVLGYTKLPVRLWT
jgi:cytochrome P450